MRCNQENDYIESMSVPGFSGQIDRGYSPTGQSECRLKRSLVDIKFGEIDFNRGYSEVGFADKVHHLYVKRLDDWGGLVCLATSKII